MQENPIRAIHNLILSNGTILPAVVGSRAASVPRDDARVTEVVNGLIVSKPAKKVTHLSNQEHQESEPEVIDLQEYAKSKAGSVTSVDFNKVKEIADFINARRY